jgi:hypothetical protein
MAPYYSESRSMWLYRTRFKFVFGALRVWLDLRTVEVPYNRTIKGVATYTLKLLIDAQRK